MNNTEQSEGRIRTNPGQAAGASAARAWRPAPMGCAAQGESTGSFRCESETLRRATFSEQFRSAAEFPRYLTQGTGQGRA
jgi:hypothetical protein